MSMVDFDKFSKELEDAVSKAVDLITETAENLKKSLQEPQNSKKSDWSVDEYFEENFDVNKTYVDTHNDVYFCDYASHRWHLISYGMSIPVSSIFTALEDVLAMDLTPVSYYKQKDA